MERKLASVQRIVELKPIAKADRIEIAKVLSWECVVKKGEFKVGDLCAYFEVDSILPDVPWAQFLKDKNHPEKPIRLKTVRLRGALSQGLALPMSILPATVDANDGLYDNSPTIHMNYTEGQDITAFLGVTKYEPPIPACLAGEIKRQYPSFLGVPKTDELRVQSFPEVVNEFKGKQVYISVKCDGTSGTFIHFNGEFDVCSRNLSLKEGGNVYWSVFKKYNLADVLTKAGNYSIQGEIVGEGIQKNRMGLKGHNLYVFNVYNLDEKRYLHYVEMVEFCKVYGLTTVPILDVCTFDYTVEQLLDMASALKYDNGVLAEGMVIRLTTESYSEALQGRSSFKVISNAYLLKNEDA